MVFGARQESYSECRMNAACSKDEWHDMLLRAVARRQKWDDAVHLCTAFFVSDTQMDQKLNTDMAARPRCCDASALVDWQLPQPSCCCHATLPSNLVCACTCRRLHQAVHAICQLSAKSCILAAWLGSSLTTESPLIL